MAFSGEISHGDIPFAYAIVAPDAKEGMIRRVRECTGAGIFTIFDPGQAIGIFTPEELREMVALADLTIMNEPERMTFRVIAHEDFVTLTEIHGKIGIETQ
jgi:sugar/nucleoside kinase (ribokinase family)